MTSSLSRVQVINGHPPNLPGKCGICGSTSGKFVDFGFDLDFYGTVYFCDSCLTEVSNAVGFYSEKQYDALVALKLELSVALENALIENQELKNALRVNFDRLAALVNAPVASFSLPEPPKPAKPAKSQPKLATAKPGPAKSADERGPKDVHDDEGDDTFDVLAI